jgi:hypothetical protein
MGGKAALLILHRKTICVKKSDDSYEEEIEENLTRNGRKTNELFISLLECEKFIRDSNIKPVMRLRQTEVLRRVLKVEMRKRNIRAQSQVT